MIILRNFGLRKFISFYIQLFKFSPPVNVEVRQVLFYLNFKKDNRVYFGGLLYFYDIIAFIGCQLSWASKT